MKIRNPKEFANAITRLRAALSEETCAGIVGRSRSLVSKWADPDHPAVPNIDQALQLDAAYVRGGHGVPPIFKLYESLLDDEVSGSNAGHDDIVPTALMLQAIIGDLSEAIRECLSGTSPALLDLSPRERSRLLEIIDRLDNETDRLEDAIDSSGR